MAGGAPRWQKAASVSARTRAITTDACAAYFISVYSLRSSWTVLSDFVEYSADCSRQQRYTGAKVLRGNGANTSEVEPFHDCHVELFHDCHVELMGSPHSIFRFFCSTGTEAVASAGGGEATTSPRMLRNSLAGRPATSC